MSDIVGCPKTLLSICDTPYDCVGNFGDFRIRCWIGDRPDDLLIVAAILVYWPMQEWFFHMNLFMPSLDGLGWTIDLGLSCTVSIIEIAVLETTFVPLKAILILIPVNVAFWSLLMSTWALAFTGICFSPWQPWYEWVL